MQNTKLGVLLSTSLYLCKKQKLIFERAFLSFFHLIESERRKRLVLQKLHSRICDNFSFSYIGDLSCY